jgi:hypothetical protein
VVSYPTVAQKIVDIDPSKPLREQVAGLGLPRLPLLIVLGDFDAGLNPQICSICSRVLAPLALTPGAIIVDMGNGTCAGLMGQACADQDRMATLVAVVPHGTRDEDVEPNHEIVFRLPEAWRDLPKYTFQIADELTGGDGDGDPLPALAILFGGGDIETKAAIRCALRDWPILAVKGTGGLADTLIDANTPGSDGTPPAPSKDPYLREILETAMILLFRIDGNMDDLRRRLLGRIEVRSEAVALTLASAWQRYDEVDAAANAKQRQFRTVELWLNFLAVVAAFLAILTSYFPSNVPKPSQQAKTIGILVILTPIVMSILAAYNSHFRDGNKWVLLRGAAEALKREIFRFRARSGVYSDEQCFESTRESKLTARRKDIDSALAQSEVNKANISQQPAGDPKRATFLSPDEYIEARIHDQVKYFESKVGSLSRRLILMQMLIYVIGGCGTFLAAIKLGLWVALTTAVVTALTTKLQADQVENSLVQYNQALASLRNIESWWRALSGWEKSRRQNIDLLVDQTEKTLESETAGWVQQMTSALDKLTEKEPAEKTTAAAKAG